MMFCRSSADEQLVQCLSSGSAGPPRGPGTDLWCVVAGALVPVRCDLEAGAALPPNDRTACAAATAAPMSDRASELMRASPEHTAADDDSIPIRRFAKLPSAILHYCTRLLPRDWRVLQ